MGRQRARWRWRSSMRQRRSAVLVSPSLLRLRLVPVRLEIPRRHLCGPQGFLGGPPSLEDVFWRDRSLGRRGRCHGRGRGRGSAWRGGARTRCRGAPTTRDERQAWYAQQEALRITAATSRELQANWDKSEAEKAGKYENRR